MAGNAKLKALVVISTLVAMNVVLSRFLSVSAWNFKIGFGFAPIAVCAFVYGPIPAAVAGALADFIGATLFPIGPFFPGFTLSAALTGAVFGLFLHKRKGGAFQAVCAALVNCFAISLLLNTCWISALSGAPFLGLLPTRVAQSCVMAPVQSVAMYAIIKYKRIFRTLEGG
ncbi:MAG: folate family ECF transporter S component [Defluviitaleaceae bacterium]|nr:folate family ECF transporter S component [Defluviitaleaceae bacterium]